MSIMQQMDILKDKGDTVPGLVYCLTLAERLGGVSYTNKGGKVLNILAKLHATGPKVSDSLQAYEWSPAAGLCIK